MGEYSKEREEKVSRKLGLSLKREGEHISRKPPGHQTQKSACLHANKAEGLGNCSKLKLIACLPYMNLSKGDLPI